MQGGRIGIPVFLCTHGCLTFLLRFHASSVDKGMLALLFSQKTPVLKSWMASSNSSGEES